MRYKKSKKSRKAKFNFGVRKQKRKSKMYNSFRVSRGGIRL